MPDQHLDEKLNDETSVPMKWLIALLVGCASFTGAAVFVGMYFGGRDASAQALSVRVDKLEEAVKKIPAMAEGIARLEGALGTLPEDRLPASSRRHEGP